MELFFEFAPIEGFNGQGLIAIGEGEVGDNVERFVVFVALEDFIDHPSPQDENRLVFY